MQRFSQKWVPGSRPHTRVVERLRGEILGEIRVEATHCELPDEVENMRLRCELARKKRQTSSETRVRVQSAFIPSLDQKMPPYPTLYQEYRKTGAEQQLLRNEENPC